MGIATRVKTMLGLPAEYRRKDFEKREKYRQEYHQLGRILVDTLDFESVLDVGCANGFLLEELQRRGKTVAGIERSPAARDVLPPSLVPLVEIGDFERAAARDERWDLVTCTEVAEHIPPHRTDELVRSLAAAAESHIYFTAAPPGQGGRGHINCRPLRDWLERFERHGWREDPAATIDLREQLAELERVPWLATNSLVLERVA